MKSKNNNRIQFVSVILLLIFSSILCKKKTPDIEIQDCDVFYNYYKDGSHYIRRDLVTDDGVLDYDKLLEESKVKNSNCYPVKELEMNTNIDIESKEVLRQGQ
jgi:hypothetical protein